jgi:hypothetical protein
MIDKGAIIEDSEEYKRKRFLVYFKVILQYFPGKTEKNDENLFQVTIP